MNSIIIIIALYSLHNHHNYNWLDQMINKIIWKLNQNCEKSK